MSVRVEFGDFQTPESLAMRVCKMLEQLAIAPSSLVEPSAGVGNFLSAGLRQFPRIKRAIAVEVNPGYFNALTTRFARDHERVRLSQADTFRFDWSSALAPLPDPVLVLTNPPWVTVAGLGRLNGANMPEKRNFQRLAGLDAKTGRSNFDVSEWALLEILGALEGRRATIAALCKTSVARRVLQTLWRSEHNATTTMFRIDAKASFGASVDACLLIVDLIPGSNVTSECRVYSDLSFDSVSHIVGMRDGHLVANAELYDRRAALMGQERLTWRSGLKHDCASVMELSTESGECRNGFGVRVKVEDEVLYPLLKSSDVANGDTAEPRRVVIVPQRSVSEDTSFLKHTAPAAWSYLQENAALLDARKSSIYRGRPRFSIFGIGPYSFLPWKIGISGLYKVPAFRLIGPVKDRPVMLDDTCYFIGMKSEALAKEVFALLSSQAVSEFLHAFLFTDSKRPITRDLLAKLDLFATAQLMGREREIRELWRVELHPARQDVQGSLFPAASAS